MNNHLKRCQHIVKIIAEWSSEFTLLELIQKSDHDLHKLSELAESCQAIRKANKRFKRPLVRIDEGEELMRYLK